MEQAWLSLRTPDEGALSGDYLEAYKIGRLCCGLELRERIGRLNFDNTSSLPFIELEGTRYSLPSVDVLYARGQLKEKN